VPAVHMEKADGTFDMPSALGRAGLLTVAKDLRLNEPYKSVVPLTTSEIGEDLATYLTESEQIPSAVGLGVFVEPDNSVSVAGGFLIQTLPPGDDEMVELLMTRLEKLPSLTVMLREGTTPEQLLEKLFEGIPYKTLEKRELAFVCSCSRERIEKVLISLGKTELSDIIEKQGETGVTCEFCQHIYSFNSDDLKRLVSEITS